MEVHCITGLAIGPPGPSPLDKRLKNLHVGLTITLIARTSFFRMSWNYWMRYKEVDMIKLDNVDPDTALHVIALAEKGHALMEVVAGGGGAEEIQEVFSDSIRILINKKTEARVGCDI